MITIKYFASLKTLSGRAEERVDLGAETTLETLCAAIRQPEIREMIRRKKIMVSVNQNMVPLDFVIRDGDEVALLPPFSGGV
ncbi:MAG: MoaD/ThiS family protein [Nitrospinales bacterium]